jgi:peptidoglycan hydrolase-like protein with peptidoglycan-binding domain
MAEVEDRMWWYRALHGNLLLLIQRFFPARGVCLLDAGCGTGGLLRALDSAHFGHRLFGLDAWQSACTATAARTGLPVVRGVLDRLPFADGAMDCLVSADVLCHENVAPAVALREMRRCLGPGGVLVLNLPAYQWLLSYHGFSIGKIDGILGGRTRTAIAACTAKHRLPATGDHKDLLAALLETLPPAADDQVALPSSAGATPRAAPDLRVIQSLLEYLGWSPGPVDGKAGPRTRNAIAGFQRSRGAVATGEVDAGLLAGLEADTRRGFGSNRTADIRLVQQLLAIRAFDPGGIDGLVGPRTGAAITAFVQAQGASPTNAIDAALLGALLAS